MLESYLDIRDRITEEPKWFDQNGVPRYAAFEPDLCPNIYADEVVLLEIACQQCRKRFFVQMSHNSNDLFSWLVEAGEIPHYGDPPHHGDCLVGMTMNCFDLRIVEFWAKDAERDWVRRPDLEIDGPEEDRQDAEVDHADSA